MSNVLEHFTLGAETQDLLGEIRRVLCGGGRVRIAVPDAEKWLRAYVEGDALFFEEIRHVWPHWPKEYSRLTTTLMYLGSLPSAGYLDGHGSGYDFETISQQLKIAGFRQVNRSAYMASADETFRIDYESRIAKLTECVDRFTLYVEALAT